jgi:hypothetical protein
VFIACASAFAQFPVDPARVPELERRFNAASANTMKCTVQPLITKLNFSLRYDAGYTVQFPKGELNGDGHNLDFALRVTPLSSTAFFLAGRAAFPPTAPREFAGRFRIDAGSYRIESLASDETGRVCRAEWKLEVKPSIAPVRLQSKGRISILLNATPANGRMVTLSPGDIDMLTGALSALTRNLSASSVRLVLFNLELKREFLRLDNFNRADFRGVRAALSAIQLATVNYRDAEHAIDPVTFLATLVNREAGGQSQMIVFLGAQAHTHQAFAAQPEQIPACYYLQYRSPERLLVFNPPPDRPSDPLESFRPNIAPLTGTPADTAPDAIEHLMQKVHGQTQVFSTPQEFARALGRLSAH